MTETRVSGEQVMEALAVLESATVSLCESMVEKFGTQRAAADRIGVSFIHFNRMMRGHAQASRDTLTAMCSEVIE